MTHTIKSEIQNKLSHVGWAVFFAHNLQGILWAEKIAHPT